MTISTRTDEPPWAAANAQRRLVHALRDSLQPADPAAAVELLETHISYVLLTGRFAYKIKKTVDLGFLDFSSLARRRFYCAEELRLNRRLAPALYLDVVAIRGAPDAPSIVDALADEGADPAEALEYAVKMHEFPQAALLDRRLAQGELSPAEIDGVAERMAGFHAQAACAGADDAYGSPRAVWAPMRENFRQLRAGLGGTASLELLDALEAWSRDEYARLAGVLASRKSGGFIRECHGDLHLGNIALWQGVPQIFDCIEFNPNLRWIDVISEVAFLSMDFEERGRPDYASRFLDRYLQHTGDYAGLQLLPFYRVYRALVRAKVALIRALQAPPADAADATDALAVCLQYLAFARRASLPRQRLLLLMHGVSGSGKTRLAQAVLERIGGLRLRSDIERKRLGGLLPLAHSQSAIDGGLYAPAMTQATYQRLAHLARLVLAAGFPVIVDAASLQRWQRDIFRRLSAALDLPFRILSCRADEAVLRRRLIARERSGGDASEAGVETLLHQLQKQEILSAAEAREATLFDSSVDTLDDALDGILQQIDKEAFP
ncbi:MAG: AAA family ATPase [Rhodocyclaceae bacterium]